MNAVLEFIANLNIQNTLDRGVGGDAFVFISPTQASGRNSNLSMVNLAKLFLV